MQLPSVMAVAGYIIPREALDAMPAYSSASQKNGGNTTSTAEPAGIGRDVLLQNVSCHVLSHLVGWHVHNSLRLIDNRTDTRPPSLFLFAKHLLYPGGSVTQQWQPALKQWEA
jgi:hypothetical protein